MYNSHIEELIKKQAAILQLEDDLAKTGFVLNGSRISRSTNHQLPVLKACNYCNTTFQISVKGKSICEACSKSREAKLNENLSQKSFQNQFPPSTSPQSHTQSCHPIFQQSTSTTESRVHFDTDAEGWFDFKPSTMTLEKGEMIEEEEENKNHHLTLYQKQKKESYDSPISRKFHKFLDQGGNGFGEGAFPPTLQEKGDHRWRRTILGDFKMREHKRRVWKEIDSRPLTTSQMKRSKLMDTHRKEVRFNKK